MKKDVWLTFSVRCITEDQYQRLCDGIKSGLIIDVWSIEEEVNIVHPIIEKNNVVAFYDLLDELKITPEPEELQEIDLHKKRLK